RRSIFVALLGLKPTGSTFRDLYAAAATNDRWIFVFVRRPKAGEGINDENLAALETDLAAFDEGVRNRVMGLINTARPFDTEKDIRASLMPEIQRMMQVRATLEPQTPLSDRDVYLSGTASPTEKGSLAKRAELAGGTYTVWYATTRRPLDRNNPSKGFSAE